MLRVQLAFPSSRNGRRWQTHWPSRYFNLRQAVEIHRGGTPIHLEDDLGCLCGYRHDVNLSGAGEGGAISKITVGVKLAGAKTELSRTTESPEAYPGNRPG